AFFALHSFNDKEISEAFFVSPIVNMEHLIENMMNWAGVSEEELQEKGIIQTEFGETLSWEYLSWVRNNQINWCFPTHILYASRDNLQSLEDIEDFAAKIGADVTVMNGGEHWFHTSEQLQFLDDWIVKKKLINFTDTSARNTIG
ncbi:MAG: alpha/beta hydrolase, partial [Alphaproteobacteria bacterium]|nr:alpha/beta hydrolase [Alphaproteobacteria bacterium]